MAIVPIIHHPDYGVAMPPQHRFPMGKFRALATRLERDGLVPNGFVTPDPCPPEILMGVHSPDYVHAILNQTLSPADVRRLGLPLTPEVTRRACLATGGTLLAMQWALTHGIACNTAGGSHHAMTDYGAGFCVFNDVAVAARHALSHGMARQILVIDLDVHHGDGTAQIFADEPRVVTVSVHCAANWPLVKPASDVDLALPVGTGDADYLHEIRHLIPSLLDRTEPDLVFYIAGVDPHADDRLGRLALSDAGLQQREHLVVRGVRDRGIPLVTVLGGGYCDDIEALASRHAMVFHAAAAAG